jgi:hypothetical protein
MELFRIIPKKMQPTPSSFLSFRPVCNIGAQAKNAFRWRTTHNLTVSSADRGKTVFSTLRVCTSNCSWKKCPLDIEKIALVRWVQWLKQMGLLLGGALEWQRLLDLVCLIVEVVARIVGEACTKDSRFSYLGWANVYATLLFKALRSYDSRLKMKSLIWLAFWNMGM